MQYAEDTSNQVYIRTKFFLQNRHSNQYKDLEYGILLNKALFTFSPSIVSNPKWDSIKRDGLNSWQGLKNSTTVTVKGRCYSQILGKDWTGMEWNVCRLSPWREKIEAMLISQAGKQALFREIFVKTPEVTRSVSVPYCPIFISHPLLSYDNILHFLLYTPSPSPVSIVLAYRGGLISVSLSGNFTRASSSSSLAWATVSCSNCMAKQNTKFMLEKKKTLTLVGNK